MEMSKEEFTRLLREAVSDYSSRSYVQIYTFLLNCFTNADTDFDGQVSPSEFNAMIDQAVNLPRRYGYAPQDKDIFSSNEKKIEGRAKMFKDIDVNGDGQISFDEWLSFANKHIIGKTALLVKDPLVHGTKDEFVDFVKKATAKRDSPEYRELYFWLLKIFAKADSNHDGCVDHSEFDAMVEEAVLAPRRHGLAPKTEDMFKSNEDRLEKRKAEFELMDSNKDGVISFNEWLEFAYQHIVKKLAEVKP